MEELTRLYNGGTQPLVLEWGKGVVMPGESFLTSHPETYGSPWTTDEETSALLSARNAQAVDTSDSAMEGDSEPQDASQVPSAQVPVTEPPAGEGPELRTLDNGDVVNEAGQVVGHIETQPNNGGNA